MWIGKNVIFGVGIMCNDFWKDGVYVCLDEGEIKFVLVGSSNYLQVLNSILVLIGTMSLCNAGLAIYDTMQYIRSPINTICLGQAASMGSLLLAAGTKGERRSLPNATIMVHQPSGGYSGQAKDMTIHTKQIVRVWDSLNALYSKHTGQPVDVIQKYMDRDYFMTPEEAKEFGIIDEVINERPIDLVSDAVSTEEKDKGKGSN